MKTLIVYGTKYGSTGTAADMLANELADGADSVRLGRDPLPALDGYQCVVVGGSIYMGRIQKEVREFCAANLERLASVRLGLFICCGEESEEKRQSYFPASFPERLVDSAVATEWFGHAFSFEKASFAHRTAVRLLKRVRDSYSELRPEAISEFACRLTS